MMDNPFLKPITPAVDTDPEQNQDLIRALLGDETAQEFAALIADQPVAPRQPRPNLKALADAAIASQATLLAASAEKQAEYFLNVELKLKFNKQVESLLAIGLLKNKEGKNGVTGIDKKFYELPTPEQVIAYFTAPERRAFIEKKVGQGFTRLLITPFAAPLNSLIEKTGTLIKKHGDKKDPSKKLLAQDGTELKLDVIDSIYSWDKIGDADVLGELVYNISKFDKTAHGGKTKKELPIDPTQPFPGFRIYLLQEDITIPRAGTGTSTKERPNL